MWIGELFVDVLGEVVIGLFDLLPGKVRLGCLALVVAIIAGVVLWVYWG
jgi:hypothetical protein